VPGIALDRVGSGQDQLNIRGIATGYDTNPLVGIALRVNDVAARANSVSRWICDAEHRETNAMVAMDPRQELS